MAIITNEGLNKDRRQRQTFQKVLTKIDSLKNQIANEKKGNRTVGSGINRDQHIKTINTMAKVDRVITPETCSGTSFQCNIAGSGKTPIKQVNTHVEDYDMLATPMTDANLTGRSFRLPILHNWKNSTNETRYTKNSLRDSYGFENFQ